MTIPHPQAPARDVLADHTAARADSATVTISLSPESARQVRIGRIVASQANPADRARALGFYDLMLGQASQAKAQGPRLEISYDQGWAKGAQRRASLNGKAWYEIEKERAGGKWDWRIYREGYFQAEGTAKSETRADQQIEDMKADLMDEHCDWGAPQHQAGEPAPGCGDNQAEDEKDAPAPTM